MSNLKKYPVLIFFAVFLFVLSIADLFSPVETFSELENRDLEKFPPFNVKTLVDNKYTPKIEDFTEDHFMLRNVWISAKSISERILGKNENNNIVYGDDNYMFTKYVFSNTANRDKRIAAVKQFIDANNTSNIKFMLAPTSPGVLSEKVKNGSPVIDCDNIITSAKDVIGKQYMVDVLPTLQEHSDEYIYYRTDHHWTSLGAYYAYAEYLSSIGRTAKPLDSFTFLSSEDFLGTHFSKAKNFDVVADSFTYIKSDATIDIMGKTFSIYDTEKLNTRDKYAMFLHGNNGFSTVSGGGSGKMLIIKDSYANSFVPFLATEFETVDVLDLRFYSQSVKALIEQGGYDEVLILYNCETFDSDKDILKLNMFN